MTKRRNPFDDTHFLQKMHIGIKEVNMGVNHVQNMKKVYDHTLQMMYYGSVTSNCRMAKMIQSRCIMQNGMLMNGSPTVQHKMLPVQNASMIGNGFLQKKMDGKNCPPSNKQAGKTNMMNPCCSSNVQMCCFFCDRIMCTTCCRKCQKCHYEFCHLCSILQYDSQEETSICLSCM